MNKLFRLISRLRDQPTKINAYTHNSIILNWHRSSNFGDLLSLYITEKLSLKSVDTLNPQNPKEHYMVIGSILSLATTESTVWGCGFANQTDNFVSLPEITMIRGEYSRERAKQLGLQHDPVLGDPGYLMSRIYQPKPGKKRYRLGLIPHWVDYELCKTLFAETEDILIIDLMQTNIETVIDQIAACDACISSSLHGIVVAHSYHIPCLFVTFSDRLLKSNTKQYEIMGGNFKYFDYFSSVSIKEYLPFEINHPDQLNEIMDAIPADCGDHQHQDRMLACCPFLAEGLQL